MSYDTIASPEVLDRTIAKLKEHNIDAVIVETGADALAKIKELIPAGASVNNGSSRTLEEIGFVELLKSGNHQWNNLHAGVLAEKDPARQAELRKLSAFSDYYLGSAHALAETGEIVFGSASGSQLAPLVFTAQNIVLVIGAQKIVSNYDAAEERLCEYVVPLEDARMKSTGAPGTVLSKMLTLFREPHFMGRKFHIIIVKEKLGF